MPTLLKNRQDAGRQLAEFLRPLAGRPRLVVLGLPPGGVPVAAEVASALCAPLDIFVAGKTSPRAGEGPGQDLEGATVVLVDDGVATGATMLAAVRTLRQAGVGEVIAAAPLMAPEAHRALERAADQCICLAVPEPFFGLGLYYLDLAPTTDAEVRSLMRRSAPPPVPLS